MRCERCGEALVHEDEQVDGVCRACERKLRASATQYDDGRESHLYNRRKEEVPSDRNVGLTNTLVAWGLSMAAQRGSAE